MDMPLQAAAPAATTAITESLQSRYLAAKRVARAGVGLHPRTTSTEENGESGQQAYKCATDCVYCNLPETD